jgi:hypothetical protein
MAKDNVKNAPAQAPAAEEGMSEWTGKFGGSVDGWWSPPEEAGTYVMKGILVNFINKDRSDKLQSNSLVFELLEDCEFVKNGGSEKLKGAKGDIVKAPKGTTIGVPEWKQLEGMWPNKAGFKAYITHPGARRPIGKGRSMLELKIQMSNGAVRHVEVHEEEDTSDAAGGGMAPEEKFQVETAS